MAKEITLIQKKVITEEEKRKELSEELLTQLAENREAVEETMQLLAGLQQAGILDAAISLLAAKEDVSKIAIEQLNREPVKNALNNMMEAGEALSSVDPEMTKQITSSLVTGLQFATDELNNGKKTKVMDFFKVLKDPDINRAITFGFSFLKAFGQGLEKK
ncbi:helical membrane plugin domain-containing protein [Bacillus sp. C1]